MGAGMAQSSDNCKCCNEKTLSHPPPLAPPPPILPANWLTPKCLDTHLGVGVGTCAAVCGDPRHQSSVGCGFSRWSCGDDEHAGDLQINTSGLIFFLFPLASHCFITYLNVLWFFSPFSAAPCSNTPNMAQETRQDSGEMWKNKHKKGWNASPEQRMTSRKYPTV